MNLDELYETFNNELFTDITLIITDNTNEITIDLHKVILYSSCIYFKKLLTNFKEKHLNEITIEVPNAFVCYDIIMSFYGQKTNIGNLPKWQHLLESVRCFDFLGLKSEADLFKDLEIPSEGFELFLKVIELIDYDDDCINMVIKNLPKDYDLLRLNKNLIKKIVEFDEDIIVSGSSDNSIKIWNAKTGALINTLTDTIHTVCVSSDNQRIVSGSSDNSIKIWNAETGILIKTLNGHTRDVNCVCFSSNNKRIVSGSADNSIKIWDAETGELIRTLTGHTNSVSSVCCSSNHDTDLVKKLENFIN